MVSMYNQPVGYQDRIDKEKGKYHKKEKVYRMRTRARFITGAMKVSVKTSELSRGRFLLCER